MFVTTRTPRKMQTRSAILKSREQSEKVVRRVKTDADTMISHSKHSSSSTLARKKQLEWEAARAKAEIEK